MHTRLAIPAVPENGPPLASTRDVSEWSIAPSRTAAPGAAVTWRRAVVGGWSFAAGTIAVAGVTFPTMRHAPPSQGVDIRVVSRLNTAGDPVVLTDAGFEPDGEGFTLAVCAADPGPFLAEVRYSHVDDEAAPPHPEGEPRR